MAGILVFTVGQALLLLFRKVVIHTSCRYGIHTPGTLHGVEWWASSGWHGHGMFLPSWC